MLIFSPYAFSLHEQCLIIFVYIQCVYPINVFVLISVPDSVNYDLQALEMSEDSFLISWKVCSEMFLVVGWVGVCLLTTYCFKCRPIWLVIIMCIAHEIKVVKQYLIHSFFWVSVVICWKCCSQSPFLTQSSVCFLHKLQLEIRNSHQHSQGQSFIPE